MKFVTKPGVHGTLYRYVVTYTDRSDNGCPEFTWYTWAYNLDHAVSHFYETEVLEEGWKALRVARVLEGVSQHRAVQHVVES